MPRPNADARFVWLLVWLVALTVRLCAAFILPNAEQDGYSYVETIAAWSAKISSGNFRIIDLFGFWLPLFQFSAAILNLVIHDPLLSGKIVSALAGSTTCVLVFALTKRLTQSTPLAVVAFALVLLNPLHLLYSAAAMTDVPFGCLSLATIWFALRDRWIAAVICAALAEFLRLEAWVFVVVLPLLQFIFHRRVSLMTMSILLVPPLVWFGISHHATGDPFAYFAKRVAYQNNVLDFYPTRRGFAFADVAEDLDYFLLGANPIIFATIFITATMSILRTAHRSREIIAVSLCTAALLAFFALAYVTKRQPVLLPRYGLVFFTLGLPLFAWLLKTLRRPIAVVALVLLLYGFVRQFPNIPKVISDQRAQQRIATALVDRIGDSRCFADDPAVRVLSRLPADHFLRSEATPASATGDATAFAAYLRSQRADYLVFIRTEDSLPVKFFPQLGRDGKIDIDLFEFIAVERSPFGPDIWLYRLRNG
jgi:hypothetical protein